MMKSLIGLATVLSALAPAIAYAHHGWSSYDASKVIKVTGTLKDVQWASPHGTASITYNGRPWRVVLAPVARMEARGLRQDMVGPRQTVTLVGYPRSDGTLEMRIERVIVGKQTVELR